MNQQINAVIIDDELLAREVVKKYVTEFPGITITAECTNGFEGLKAINELKPDLLFLDIQMPKITGFEMLELIDNPPAIIFATAYDHYALKAFEVNAADYLLKPFSQERFNEAVNKTLQRLGNASHQKQINESILDHNNQNSEYLERVVTKSGSKIIIIPIENLNFIEAADDYVMLHSEEGKHLKQKTMKFFEDKLNPSHFIRIHRSYIVPVNRIKQIELVEKETYRLHLKSGEKLPVSKSGYAKLKEVLN